MKQLFFVFALLFLYIILHSQKTGYFFVWFKDKANNNYTLLQPQQFLTQRSIERRMHYNISLDSTDLPVSDYYINEVKSKGANIHSASKWLNGVIALILDDSTYDKISSLSFVNKLTYLKPLAAGYSTKSKNKLEIYNEIKANLQEYTSHQIEMLNGHFLHEKGYTGNNMLIAVLDAGFDGVDTISYFKRLFYSNKVVFTRDVVSGYYNNDVYGYHAHGTMVLSIMGGYKENEFKGSATDASYALIITEDGNTEYIFEEYCWVIGAELADSIGADVINSSLGYTIFDDPSMNHTWSDLNGKTSVASIAATMCARKGMIVVCSAGNWGSQDWRKIGIPADADSILTVGAVDSNGFIAFFSSQGYSADGRIKPTIVAQGHNDWCISAYTGLPTQASGTSFSSPLIAGLTACLWQALRDSNNMAIYNAIIKSANRFYNPDSLYGYGLPNFAMAFYILNNVDKIDFNQIKIFPVPAYDYIFINNSELLSDNCRITITNLMGQAIYEKYHNKDENSIFIGTFEKGLYFISLQSESTYFISKFVKY